MVPGARGPNAMLSFQRPLLESAELLPQPSEPSGMQASQFKDLPPLPSRPTLGGPPVLDRSLSAASCELRNPFRSNTSDTVTTISMSRASSFGDAALPVRRTVPIWFPEQTEGAVDPPSHKAAIFTNAALGLDTAADPFSDDSSGNEDAELSTTPTTTSSAHSDMQEVCDCTLCIPLQFSSFEQQDMRPNTQKRSRWSFLKSPKQSAQDFLQVHIPSGTLSPPARHRHSFWSRA